MFQAGRSVDEKSKFTKEKEKITLEAEDVTILKALFAEKNLMKYLYTLLLRVNMLEIVI